MPRDQRYLFGFIFGVVANEDDTHIMRTIGKKECPKDAIGVVVLESFEVFSGVQMQRTKDIQVLQCFKGGY